MINKVILIIFILAFPILASAQQTFNIGGTVTEADGSPMIGVSVAVKGTAQGTITDVNGKYSISVPDEKAALVFSYLGYAPQEILVGSQRSINITLKENVSLLDEVVVVGYGTVKKANLTGAVDQIDSKILEDRPVTSVAQALQGTMANLNITSSTGTSTSSGGSPAAQMSMNIRGITSFSGSSSYTAAGPLIVVDGVQGQDINDINPNDIESISILKDAASSAIYGSNAPYGVVLITTKKGKKNAKPTITYGANLGWLSPIHLPKQVNSVEFAAFMNEAQQNTNGRNFFSDNEMQRIQDYFDGKITTETVVTPSGGYASFDDAGTGRANANNEWFSIMLKDNSFTQQHNIGLQGGAQNINYYLGFGYLYKDGLIRFGGDSFDRYNVRTNISSEITKWFTANARWQYTRSTHERPTYTHSDFFMESTARKWPIIPVRNNNWETYPNEYSSNSYIGYYLYGGRNNTANQTNVMTGEFVITPLKGWNTIINYTYTDNKIADVKNTLSWTTHNSLDRLIHFPAWTGDGFDQYSRAAHYMDRIRTDNIQQTINAYTSYEINLNDHYLKGMVGYAQEYIHNYRMNILSGKVTLFNLDIPTFGNMYYTENAQSVTEPVKQTLTTRGTFGRINYGYKNKYLLELNGRYDGTSRYMKDVRFKFYPGVSAAWVVSQENFWSETLDSKVDFLKVRASYGSLGEQTGGYYPFYPSLGVTTATSGNTTWLFDGSRFNSLSYPGIVNPNLTWVTSSTFDLGMDVTFLKNRMAATFDWYNRLTTDIIGPAEELPAVLGAAAPATNNAEMRTRGFELTLSWKDRIQSIGLNYGVRASIADSKSKILKYPNEKKLLSSWYEGQTVGDIWGYVTEGFYTQAEQNAGIDQNVQGNPKGLGTNWTAGDVKYKDLDGDGLITYGDQTLNDPGDRKIIGNQLPRYTFGITLDASWKGFDISAFFQGVAKQDVWLSNSSNSSNLFWITPGTQWGVNYLTAHRDRWTPETPDGYHPKYYLNAAQNQKNQQRQTKYLQNAAYMRLKNLQIGYTLPASLLSKAGIDKTRIYLSGENLATFTKMVKTIDPELALTTAGLGYPLQKTISVGLNISF